MHMMHDVWCMWSAVVCMCSGILTHLPERFSGQSPPPCQVAAVLAGCSLGAVDQTWHDGGKRPPQKISPLHPLRQESLSSCTHTTAHMHHASHIMCIVTVWHPSIGNIIPISGYITLDTPVTVVTSGELWNQNWAVSKTKTWQLYGAKVKVFVDHANLAYYRHPQKVNQQVAWYIVMLADYDIDLVYRAGKLNKADTLSRWPDYNDGHADNEDVTALPDTLFVRHLETLNIHDCIWCWDGHLCGKSQTRQSHAQGFQ